MKKNSHIKINSLIFESKSVNVIVLWTCILVLIICKIRCCNILAFESILDLLVYRKNNIYTFIVIIIKNGLNKILKILKVNLYIPTF